MVTGIFFSRAIGLPLVAGFLALLPAGAHAADAPSHPLTIDNVLDTVALDRIAPSPDGEWIAAVVQRPAQAGEVFGRAAYETDPSRNDVWLISRRTGERRNLTQGSASAAGFWCAAWSPDGSKLAMLSTRPEGQEPRGGDNVRLYVWDRATAALTRMSDAAVMTQTRYGSPIHTLDLRGGADGGTVAQNCTENQENAPFTWIDGRRLLVVTLPAGQVSALLDEYGRPFDHAARTRTALRNGDGPTATAMGSGAERVPRDDRADHAVIQVIDADSRTATRVATIPSYPLHGALSLAIAPDRRRIAMLAPVGSIQPARGQPLPHHNDEWLVEKRLGFIDLATPGNAVRWVELPAEARYPVELLGWAPDSRSTAFRARGAFPDKATPLFIASADTLAAKRIAAPLTVGTSEAGPYPGDPAAMWVDARQLLVKGRAGGRDDWWLVRPGTAPVNLTAGLAAPPWGFQRVAGGRLIAIAGKGLMTLDAAGRRLVPLAAPSIGDGARFIWPQDSDTAAPVRVTVEQTEAGWSAHILRFGEKVEGSRVPLVPGATLVGVTGNAALWRQPTREGLFLREVAIEGGATRDLLALNTHLAKVDWGETRLIDYNTAAGQQLKGAVILPPDYREGQRYPVITWVYPRYLIRGLNDPFLDPYMPGIYNLQLYAARGYVVLIPSAPLEGGSFKDATAELGKGVLPAIDRLAAMGIADPERVGVMGQSGGGYAVYSLITQTNRFRAAVALAGLTDLAQLHTQFDAAARGYPGIEHEKSGNWSINEAGMGFDVPPYEDHDLYWRNSPIAYVGRVQTPLLLVHGEFDKRGAMTQAETFFYSLYRQGKTARLLRYWGESHSLAQSPANVRDIVEESLRWFDRYLAAEAKP